MAGLHEAEAWAAAFNQSFIDHDNFHPLTAELVRHDMGRPTYHAAGDLVAVAPDGSFAGFCDAEVNPHENARSGRSEGWIRVLGTCRGHRGIGLGRALLLAGLQYLRDQGVATARLGVDAENPSGALGFYERAGFSRTETTVAYTRTV